MDKNLLFKPRLAEAEVEIPGVGTVRVRALSRDEATAVQNAKGTAATERKILELGMVDPTLTENEVLRWQQNCPAGEIEPIVRKISELSGLLKESEKEAMSTFRDEPGDGVRALPGSEAGDDGGPASGGDE